MAVAAVAFSALVNLVGTNVSSTATSVSLADAAEFPYHASLRRNNSHFCGGSIINANTILTAAHCVFGLSLHDVTAVVGSNSFNNDANVHPALFSRCHEFYDPKTTLNDIAVVKLLIPITYTDHIRKIGLSTFNPYKNQEVILNSWTKASTHENVNKLQVITLNAVDLVICAEGLNGDKPVGTGHLCTRSMFNHGASKGDSGGPLIDQRGLQVGIVSWGVPDEVGHPDVFTSVSFYRKWILLHL